MLILNLERTLFIRHQNGCLTKIAIKFDCFLTIGILPSLYFVVSDSKISATVKNSGKKFTKITPCGPALQLHRADYAMVYGGNLRSLVTSEVQGVLPFGGKGTHRPFRQIVRDRITAVLYISEGLIPKLVKIIQGLPHITTFCSSSLFNSCSRFARRFIIASMVGNPCRRRVRSPSVIISLSYSLSKRKRRFILSRNTSALLSPPSIRAFTNFALTCARQT